MYQETWGDLIYGAKNGAFDVIAHGVNCFCKQANGLAPQMVAAFQTDSFPLEDISRRGDINKLGQIDYVYRQLGEDRSIRIVNCYTQYNWATPHNPEPFDYEAFTLCMRKMNLTFHGMRIGLPRIGAGLAGGDWNGIKQIIQQELTNCRVTIVNYSKP